MGEREICLFQAQCVKKISHICVKIFKLKKDNMNGKTSSVKKRVKSEEIGKHRDFGKMKMPRHGMKDSIRNRWRSEFASDLCLLVLLRIYFHLAR